MMREDRDAAGTESGKYSSVHVQSRFRIIKTLEFLILIIHKCMKQNDGLNFPFPISHFPFGGCLLMQRRK